MAMCLNINVMVKYVNMSKVNVQANMALCIIMHVKVKYGLV